MGSTIRQSVGRGGINRADDVRVVQELLNGQISLLTPLRPLTLDGKAGTQTVTAIEQFQRRVVGMPAPDGRVDPNGRTLALLAAGPKPAAPPPAPVAGTFTVTFAHGGKIPERTSAAKGTDALYESAVTIAGPKTGTFRGSIYPDDLSVKGRIQDGSYDLYIGFHKRAGAKPAATDLIVRTQGFRAALIVNLDKPVPVLSDNPSKTTSETIHVHNGFNSSRGSEGCQTLHPSDWAKFIQLFLDAFPSLTDWTSTNTYVGKKIGTLEVKA